MKIEQYETKTGDKGYILKGAFIGTDKLTGKQVRTTIRGKSKKEVERKLNLKKREFEDNGYTKEVKCDIKNGSELIDNWLEYYKDSGIRDATFYQISVQINKHIRPLIGDIKLDNITPKLMSIKVNQFKKNIKNELKGYDNMLSRMKTILQYGVEQEFLKSNPMANIKTGKDKKDRSVDKKEKELKYYNKEQIDQIRNSLQSYPESGSIHDMAFVTYIQILLFTGARASEILALTWSDIDFNNKTMNIDKTLSNQGKITETPKTDAGIRTIELNTMTTSVLKKWRGLLFENCLKFGITRPSMIFYNISKDTNYSYRHFLDKYRTFCKKNGLPYLRGLHAFRHTYATMHVASGEDYKTLQEILGHEKIAMTMDRYAKALPENKRKATENAIKFMTT